MQRMSRNWSSQKEITAPDIARVIDTYVIGLHAERNRAILKRRFIDGIAFEPLAEEFNLSVRQTKNIVYRNFDKVFDHL